MAEPPTAFISSSVPMTFAVVTIPLVPIREKCIPSLEAKFVPLQVTNKGSVLTLYVSPPFGERTVMEGWA
jgi:hypothetical protein